MTFLIALGFWGAFFFGFFAGAPSAWDKLSVMQLFPGMGDALYFTLPVSLSVHLYIAALEFVVNIVSAKR